MRLHVQVRKQGARIVLFLLKKIEEMQPARYKWWRYRGWLVLGCE
jgi:hypothetical protein